MNKFRIYKTTSVLTAEMIKKYESVMRCILLVGEANSYFKIEHLQAFEEDPMNCRRRKPTHRLASRNL